MNAAKTLFKICLWVLYPFLLMACATSTTGTGTDDSSYAISKQKKETLADIGQFKFDNREAIYKALNKLSLQLYRAKKREVLKTVRTNTIDNYPVLKLIDLDGDGNPEQFVYIKKDARAWDTPDYGYIYDLNGDGRVDYVVYNQGIVRAENKQRAWTYLHTLYHWIDSNDDGIIDTWVYPDIDLNADGMVDSQVSGWLYDINGDGIVDSGEYLGPFMKQDIKIVEGKVNIKRYGHESIDSVNRNLSYISELSKKVLADINNLI